MILNIEEIAAKAWESSYPDRSKWKELSPDTKAEWVRVFTEYENHRSEVDEDKIRANQLSLNVEFLIRALDEIHLRIIGLTGIRLLGTWQERVSDVVNFSKAVGLAWDADMREKIMQHFKTIDRI
jgi:type I restriction-modification system DNA methylase subunit